MRYLRTLLVVIACCAAIGGTAVLVVANREHAYDAALGLSKFQRTVLELYLLFMVLTTAKYFGYAEVTRLNYLLDPIKWADKPPRKVSHILTFEALPVWLGGALSAVAFCWAGPGHYGGLGGWLLGVVMAFGPTLCIWGAVVTGLMRSRGLTVNGAIAHIFAGGSQGTDAG